jgi:hypothetical protein
MGQQDIATTSAGLGTENDSAGKTQLQLYKKIIDPGLAGRRKKKTSNV